MGTRRRPSSRNGVRPFCVGLASVLAGAAALVAAPDDAAAQAESLSNEQGGANAHLFRPPVDSKGFITVNGADVVGHLDSGM